MKPIIEIQGIGKKFRLHHERKPYLSLREEMSELLSGRRQKSSNEDFWALQNISFEVDQGESIGIIGKNGAGKSTLMKILAKITPPTEGKIIARGRIASLLEVGTGFHPELTGRENVYFNGSILGMKRREIDSRFDEIIDFAGTERFLDTPLKHYSSGMQLRLAFAVAAFLEPEILIIDEVLAVGDAEFQRKCLGKMEEVSQSGRTVLFVSHNMAAIQSLCSKSILLDRGILLAKGDSADVINGYLNAATHADTSNGTVVFDDAKRTIKKIELYCNGTRTDLAHMGCRLEIRVYFSNPAPLDYPVLGVIVKDHHGAAILGINNNHYIGNVASRPIQKGFLSVTIPYLSLMNGIYSIDVHLGDNITDLDIRRDCLSFVVEKLQFTPSGNLPDERINKFFIPDVIWQAESEHEMG